MSLMTFSPLRYGFCLLLVALTLLTIAAPTACAAPTQASLPAVLPAFDMMEIVHDRSRLIQFSVVAVAIGIGLLWWGNKT
jgi:hypothetical protein